ncbi:MAG: efflux RND transporter permease subunit [Planctomycetota bacterium]
MSLPAFGVRRPVVANLVMLALVGAGLIFGSQLRREFFPEVRPNIIAVNAAYPGATPDEVEESLATKIEDELATIDGVKEMNTTVTAGSVTVRLELEEGEDVDAVIAEVKRDVDALQDLPEEVDNIVAFKIEPNLPAIALALYGDGDEAAMKEAIRSIRDDLETLPGMGDIGTDGIRRAEIRVEVRPEAMLKHNLSLPAVAEQVRNAMRELPGGTIRTGTQNLAVRAPGTQRSAEFVRGIPVKAGDDGQRLTLGDIADVRDTFADVDLFTRFNGQPSVSLTAFKIGDQDAVDIAEMVKAYVAGRNGEPYKLGLVEKLKKAAAELRARRGDTPLDANGDPIIEPSAISARFEAHQLGARRATEGELPGTLVATTDLARFIVGRLELLARNAIMGGVLVFGTLLLLLSWRTSLWVAAGLSVALAGTLAVMYATGVTLNLVAMFGLIIVLGILVDDAIVVAENIKARHEKGEDATTASIRGTRQVMWPVIATIITTIFAFMPLGIIDGRIGDIMGVLPLVVVCALSVSLIECLFILPSHMHHALEAEDRAERSNSPLARFDRFMNKGREAFFNCFLIPGYLRILRPALRARYLTLSAAIALVVISFGMVAGGRVPFTFITSSDAETINGELRMPIGTPANITDGLARRIEAVALGMPEVDSVFTQVGAIGSIEGDGSSNAPYLAQIIIELKSVEIRSSEGMRRSDQVISAIREELGPLEGVKSLRLEELAGGSSGPPINLAIVGENEDSLQVAADELASMLDDFEGVYDVANNAERGQRELTVSLRSGASELGFTVANVAQQVRAAVFGLEPFTFAGEREDVDVRVTLPERVRRSPAAIESMYIFTPAGQPVPLAEVAVLEETESFASIRRLDRVRQITVTADVNQDTVSPESVVANLGPQLRDLEQALNVRVVPRGRQKDQAESFATLPLGMVLAIGLIGVVLIWLFESWIQPVIVLTAVPFATVGMIWGHYLLGYEMTILSLIGFIALAGVVVNDSLIFMQFYNERRRDGLRVYEACIEAGRARVRAILLTTVTTVLGLLPLMLEQSFQARFLIPMAITIAFGLISATGVILLVLPSLLLVFADIQRWASMAWTGEYKPPTEMQERSAMAREVLANDNASTD